MSLRVFFENPDPDSNKKKIEDLRIWGKHESRPQPLDALDVIFNL